MNKPDYHGLWARLHTAAKSGHTNFILSEFKAVTAELKQIKNCPCYDDANIYLLAILCGNLDNIHLLNARGTTFLFELLHNLVNLKLDKPSFYALQ